MKLPKSIRVAGVDWLIEPCGEETLPDDRHADCDLEKLRIRISSKLKPQAATKVLLHEIRHALNHEDSEQECERWAQEVCQIMFDNPDLVKRFRRSK